MLKLLLGGIVASLAVAPAAAGEIVVFCPGAVQSVVVPAELGGRWQSVLTGRAVELVRTGSSLGADMALLLPASQPVELLMWDNR